MSAFAIQGELAGRLEPVDGPEPEPCGLRAAAVLALLFPGDQPRLLLIERSKHLRNHAGQLAFPGGKREPQDRTLLETALRESEEEVGLPREESTVVGRLRTIPTPTGFQITPFVGIAPAGYEPRAASGEVSRILLPTLAKLADPSIYHVKSARTPAGLRYKMHEYRISEPPLWGATAFMVHDLLARISTRCAA